MYSEDIFIVEGGLIESDFVVLLIPIYVEDVQWCCFKPWALPFLDWSCLLWEIFADLWKKVIDGGISPLESIEISLNCLEELRLSDQKGQLF